jgi:hypothetical protein
LTWALENEFVVLVSACDVRDNIDKDVPIWAPGMDVNPAPVIHYRLAGMFRDALSNDAGHEVRERPAG